MASNGANGTSLPSTQKAAQFNPKTGKAEINEILVPSIKAGEILVKITAASLCHSDLMLFEENEQGLILGTGDPFTMGHEGCGTILQLGADVPSDFKKGDKIGWLCIIDVCFECDAYRQLHNLYCEKGNPKVQGMTVDGYFQQYAAIKWQNAAHIPEGMDMTNLAPMFCAGCTAFNAVTDTLAYLPQPYSETYVAVIGCGGLGHLGIQYLKAHGCKVIGIDLSPDALDEAAHLGADHIFNPQQPPDYAAQIRALTPGGKGCHAAINFTNSAPSYAATVDLLRYHGVLMVTGIPQKPLQFSAMDVSMLRVRVRGSNNGTTRRLKECLAFSAAHGIKPRVTQFRLEQFEEMLELMRSGRHNGRVGVLFDGE